MTLMNMIKGRKSGRRAGIKEGNPVLFEDSKNSKKKKKNPKSLKKKKVSLLFLCILIQHLTALCVVFSRLWESRAMACVKKPGKSALSHPKIRSRPSFKKVWECLDKLIWLSFVFCVLYWGVVCCHFAFWVKRDGHH